MEAAQASLPSLYSIPVFDLICMVRNILFYGLQNYLSSVNMYLHICVNITGQSFACRSAFVCFSLRILDVMDRGTRPKSSLPAVKKEEQQLQNQLRNLSNLGVPPRGPPGSVEATPSNPTANTLSEIELPPRFLAMMEHISRTQPELTQRRYEEFLKCETQSENTTLQDADQVKL